MEPLSGFRQMMWGEEVACLKCFAALEVSLLYMSAKHRLRLSKICTNLTCWEAHCRDGLSAIACDKWDLSASAYKEMVDMSRKVG